MTFYFQQNLFLLLFPFSANGTNTHLVLPVKDMEVVLDLSITPTKTHTSRTYPVIPKHCRFCFLNICQKYHFSACYHSKPGYYHLPWITAPSRPHPRSTITSPSPFHSVYCSQNILLEMYPWAHPHSTTPFLALKTYQWHPIVNKQDRDQDLSMALHGLSLPTRLSRFISDYSPSLCVFQLLIILSAVLQIVFKYSKILPPFVILLQAQGITQNNSLVTPIHPSNLSLNAPKLRHPLL